MKTELNLVFSTAAWKCVHDKVPLRLRATLVQALPASPPCHCARPPLAKLSWERAHLTLVRTGEITSGEESAALWASCPFSGQLCTLGGI